MKVKLKQEEISSAFDSTELEFDLHILYKLLDKLPTIYYEKVIEDEFFNNIFKGQYFALVKDGFGVARRFTTRAELIHYCVKNNICSREAVIKGLERGTSTRSKYHFERVLSTYKDEGSEVVDSD